VFGAFPLPGVADEMPELPVTPVPAPDPKPLFVVL